MMKSCKNGYKSIVVIAVAAIAFCFSGSVLEATIYFNVADGNWTNPASWNPQQVPYTNDETRVQNGGTLHVNSDEKCWRLYIGSTTGGNGNLEMASGSIEASDNISIGRYAYGTFIQSGGDIVSKYLNVGESTSGSGEYTLSNGTITASGSFYIGNGGTGVFHQAGGIVTLPNGVALRIGFSSGSDGRYEMSGGTATFEMYAIGRYGHGYFKQTGGTVIAKRFACPEESGTGTYELVGGTLVMSNNLIIGASSSGGGGTFLFGDADGTGTLITTNGNNNLQICATTGGTGVGVFRGWGEVNLGARIYLAGGGSIIADGYGIDRDLNLQGMDPTWNTYTNGAGQAGGVYAQNHGRLVYRAQNVVTYTYYYGESNDSRTTNVINSAVVHINMNSGGSILHVALLASDRNDVAPDIRTIGTWGFSLDDPAQLNSATLSFRYDDSLVPSLGIPESELLILRRNGNNWDDVTGSIDTVRHTITTTSLTDINSQFVVGLPPLPKGTVILVK